MEAKKSFGDAIVSQELNKEAWKKLSREFKWNEELLRKYLSEIDWKELSGNAPERLLTSKIIERFADQWDWHELSDNSNLKLSYALLDKFADKWDWERIINRWHDEELYTPDFVERYKEFIPAKEFQGSYLWDALVEKRFDELVEEIMG